jgi:hypothetical protein
VSNQRNLVGRIGLIALGAIGILVVALWSIADHAGFMPKSGCPIIAWMRPIDRSGVLPTDYIELNSTAIGPRLFEPVHVRICGDGLVERDTVITLGGYTFGCPLHDSEKRHHISQSAFQALLAKARDGGFCRLCARYSSPGVMDGGIEEVTLNLHGRLATVWNLNGNPPPLLDELAGRIWGVSEIESVADHRKFTPEREAECRRIEEARIRR